jgi:hypothetical protein
MQAERVWSLNGIRREVPFLLNLVLYVSLTTSMVQKYNQRCRNRDNDQTMFASPHFFRQKFKKKMNFQQKRIVQLTNCKGVSVCKVFFRITVLKTCTPSHTLLHSKNSELWYQKLMSILTLIVDDEVQKQNVQPFVKCSAHIFFPNIFNKILFEEIGYFSIFLSIPIGMLC